MFGYCTRLVSRHYLLQVMVVRLHAHIGSVVIPTSETVDSVLA